MQALLGVHVELAARETGAAEENPGRPAPRLARLDEGPEAAALRQLDTDHEQRDGALGKALDEIGDRASSDHLEAMPRERAFDERRKRARLVEDQDATIRHLANLKRRLSFESSEPEAHGLRPEGPAAARPLHTRCAIEARSARDRNSQHSGGAARVRILVAADNRCERRLVCHVVSSLGHEPVAVEDGKTALERILRERIQLAVLDWMMPGLTGVEVCSELARMQRPVHTIILTARESRDAVRALEAGARDYLTKPCELRELRARIHAGTRSALEDQASRRRRGRGPSVRGAELAPLFDTLAQLAQELEGRALLADPRTAARLRRELLECANVARDSREPGAARSALTSARALVEELGAALRARAAS